MTDGFVALPDFVAKGGLDLQLPAGHQAEFDFIAAPRSKPTAAR